MHAGGFAFLFDPGKVTQCILVPGRDFATKMPLFQCVQCCDCSRFQSAQARKDKKFSCKICGKKQSVRKVRLAAIVFVAVVLSVWTDIPCVYFRRCLRILRAARRCGKLCSD